MQDGDTIEIWRPEQVRQGIESSNNNDARFLLAAYFGTGARLRELLKAKKKDFYTENKDGIEIIKVTLQTFKSKKYHKRVIHLFPAVESWFTSIIMDRVNLLPDLESLLFKKSGRWIEYKFQEWFKTNPHTFRHSRATYNRNFWRMNSVENKLFMGWSDERPEATYVHLIDADRIERMVERLKMVIE